MGSFPSVGLTLTWFIWDINLALHITPYSVNSNLKQLSCRVVSDSPYRMSNYVVYSDASATGCGAHLDINGEQVCNKQWDLEERRRRSTWREFYLPFCSLYICFYPYL